jgi:hypothetical protein
MKKLTLIIFIADKLKVLNGFVETESQLNEGTTLSFTSIKSNETSNQKIHLVNVVL